ncbi:biotin transporter BioY [Cellulomonas denverensis]|uniref:biotin transporter BioY n=1 Tax=Cellulomonas denverensis TaxID=264297 RepID=UPI0035ED3056
MTDPQPQPATVLPAPAVRRSAATDLALIASFAALVAVCAVLPAIPVGGAVPITLQTFGVALTGLVLGPRRGFLAMLLYVAVGLAGLPVLSGATGGLGVLAGASAGYLLAFPLAAAVAGAGSVLARRAAGRWQVPAALFAAATAGSLLVVHPLGIAVMGWRLGLSATEALTAGAVFLPGDVLKNVLAAVVAAAVLRAFPELRRR